MKTRDAVAPGKGKAELRPCWLGDRAVSMGFIPRTMESNRKGFVRGAAQLDVILF